MKLKKDEHIFIPFVDGQAICNKGDVYMYKTHEKAKHKYSAAEIVEYVPAINTECDLCRSGKQIIVYGVDYAIDTKSEYHRIETKYCPVCGRKLEDSHDKD